jgi:hypothetical protein
MSTMDERSARLIEAMNKAPANTVPWWHWMHQWTRWKFGEADVASAFKGLVGPRMIQHRTCVRCDMMQARNVPVKL